MKLLFAGSTEEYTELIEKTGSNQLPCLFFAPDIWSIADLTKPEYYDASVCVLPLSRFLHIKALDTASQSAIPLLVSGPADSIDEAFGCGCADYLVEPWTIHELMARSRRCASIKLGSLHFVCGQNSLQSLGANCHLTMTEARILRLLLANRSTGCSRQALAENLELEFDSRALDMRISRLRKKLQFCDPLNQMHIECRGKNGYRLVELSD